MYEKQTWANGDIITAEKLNNIENGILGNNFIIREIYDEGTDEYEYIADAVYDWDTTYDHIYLIHDGEFIQELDNRTYYFQYLSISPMSNPTVFVSIYVHDQNDETGLKYTRTDYNASLQFTQSN